MSSHRRTCNSHTALYDYSRSHRWRCPAIAAPVTASELYMIIATAIADDFQPLPEPKPALTRTCHRRWTCKSLTACYNYSQKPMLRNIVCIVAPVCVQLQPHLVMKMTRVRSRALTRGWGGLIDTPSHVPRLRSSRSFWDCIDHLHMEAWFDDSLNKAWQYCSNPQPAIWILRYYPYSKETWVSSCAMPVDSQQAISGLLLLLLLSIKTSWLLPTTTATIT